MNVVTLTPLWKVLMDAISRALDGTCYVVRGCAPTANGTGLRVDVAAGDTVEGGTPHSNYAGGNVTLSAASSAVSLLYRRDLVYRDSAGTLTVAAGTAALLTATTPVPPALPASATLIAVCFVAPGQTVLVATDVEDCRQTRVADIPGMNVKAFGAKGDGSTDDTTSIQAALNAVPAAGATVTIPPGTYIVTALTLPSNVRVIGAGAGSTTLKLKDGQAASTRMMTATGKTNVYVEHLGFDGNKANQAADVVSQQSHCIFFSTGCTNVHVHGCRIINSSGDGIFFYGSSVANQNTQCCAEDNYILNSQRQSISVGGAQFVMIRGNYIEGGGGIHTEADDDGMPTRDVTVVGNTLKNCNGITFGGAPTFTNLTNFERITVSGNTLTGCGAASAGSIEVNTFNYVTLVGNVIGTATAYGINLRSTKSVCADNIISSAVQHGIIVNKVAGAASLVGMTISGNTVTTYDTSGAAVSGIQVTANDSVVTGNTVWDGQNTGDVGIGLYDCNRVACTGNRCGASANRATGVGIWERNNAATSDENTIGGNRVHNFNTALTVVGLNTRAWGNQLSTGGGVGFDFNYATNALGGGAAPTLGTIGGTGPAAAGQDSWLKVRINGTDSWIPVWR